MKDCWKFFAGLAAGFLALLALNLGAFALVLGVPTESSRWTFEIVRKKQALAGVAAPPRLLVVAGSSALFGIDARELESETGWRTINLGSHAVLGADYMLKNTEEIARPGDVVLLAFEYELYNSRPIGRIGTDSLWVDYMVAHDPAYLRALSRSEQWTVFMLTSMERLKFGLRNRFNPSHYKEIDPGGGVYSLNYVNEWGDQTHHPHSAATIKFTHLSTRPALAWPEHPTGFPAIESFCRWAKEHHIRVLATYPNILDQPSFHTAPAKENAARIAGLFGQLGVPVVGDYTDALLPSDQFFDTVYHLTDEAALTRTKRLAEKLKPLLGQPPVAVKR